MKIFVFVNFFYCLQALSQNSNKALPKLEDDFSTNKEFKYSFKVPVSKGLINYTGEQIVWLPSNKNFLQQLTKDTIIPQGYSNEINNYNTSTSKATILFLNKQYEEANFLYEKAFKENNNLGKVIDRYRAACGYAFLNDFDNAFTQLEKLTTKGRYFNLQEIKTELAFLPLHKNERWKKIIANVENNVSTKLNELNSNINKN